MSGRMLSNRYFKSMQECYFTDELVKLWKQIFDSHSISGSDFINLVEMDVMCAYARRSKNKDKCYDWIFCEQKEDWYLTLLEYPLLVQECAKQRSKNRKVSEEVWRKAWFVYYDKMYNHEIAIVARNGASEECLNAVAERLYAICNIQKNKKKIMEIFKHWTDQSKLTSDDRVIAAKNNAEKECSKKYRAWIEGETENEKENRKYVFETVYMLFWELKQERRDDDV